MSRTDCAFDTQGNLLWSDDGGGRTVYAYDAESRLTAAVYPDGSCLELGYDAAGNVNERRSPGSKRERFASDPGRIKLSIPVIDRPSLRARRASASAEPTNPQTPVIRSFIS